MESRWEGWSEDRGRWVGGVCDRGVQYVISAALFPVFLFAHFA